MSKVSIIVPIYNAEKYLDRCVLSLINQTEQDIEIVLVDDGSSDGSLDVCYKYQLVDPRIIVFHKDNGGPHSARKKGIELSCSKWVAFADADDWIENTLISSLVTIMCRFDVELVASGLCNDEDGIISYCYNEIPSGLYEKSNLVSNVYEKMLCDKGEFSQKLCPSLCGKLFLRERIWGIANKLDDDIRVAEDLACTLPYVLVCNSIYVTNEICGYHYCKMKETLSHEYDRDYFNKIGRLFGYFDKVLMDFANSIVKQNFETYKVYLIYRQLTRIFSVKERVLFNEFCVDFMAAGNKNIIVEPLKKCNIMDLNIGKVSKVLLFLMKKKRTYCFKVICVLIFYRNKVSGISDGSR